MELFKQNFPKSYARFRFPNTRASASSPCRRKVERLIRSAIQYAVANSARADPGSQGQHQKFTEGASATGATSWPRVSFAADIYRGSNGKDQGARGEKDATPRWMLPAGRQGHRERCNRGHRPAEGADALG